MQINIMQKLIIICAGMHLDGKAGACVPSEEAHVHFRDTTFW